MVIYMKANKFKSLPLTILIISCGKLDSAPKYDKPKLFNFQEKKNGEKNIRPWGWKDFLQQYRVYTMKEKIDRFTYLKMYNVYPIRDMIN